MQVRTRMIGTSERSIADVRCSLEGLSHTIAMYRHCLVN